MQQLGILASSCIVPSRDPAWTSTVPASLKRRDPRIWQMAYAAAAKIIDISNPPRSIVIGTALGALDETREFLDGVFTDGFGSPRSFIASVHNSMAGKIAMEFGIEGPNLTICEGQHSFASALISASLLRNEDFPVLLIIADERIELLDQLHDHFSPLCKEYLDKSWDEAAVAFLLAHSDRSDLQAHIRAFGPAPSRSGLPGESLDELVKSVGISGASVTGFPASSRSYVLPALLATGYCASQHTDQKILGSYCPVSRSVALVELSR